MVEICTDTLYGLTVTISTSSFSNNNKQVKHFHNCLWTILSLSTEGLSMYL